MFAHVTDASKTALAHLARWLDIQGVEMIDCQMNTAHLSSLGAREISRQRFRQRLDILTARPTFAWPVGRWQFDWSSAEPASAS